MGPEGAAEAAGDGGIFETGATAVGVENNGAEEETETQCSGTSFADSGGATKRRHKGGLLKIVVQPIADGGI